MKHPAIPALSALPLLALLALLALPALSQAVVGLPPVSTITFAPGSALSTVNGEMVAGGRDLYYVQAKAGQTMLVSVTSEGDVTLQIYTPETSLAKAADGAPLIQGKTLPNAGQGDNAKAWVGAIPRAGNYLIALGMEERGAVLAPYSLTVSLQ